MDARCLNAPRGLEESPELWSLIRRCVEPVAHASLIEVLAHPKPGAATRLSPWRRLRGFASSHTAFPAYVFLAAARGYFSVGGDYTVGDLLLRSVEDSILISGREELLGEKLLLLTLAYGCGRAERLGVAGAPGIALAARDALRENSTVSDAVAFYRAVRIAGPSHIGRRPAGSTAPDIWSSMYRDTLLSKRIRLWDVVVDASEREMVFDEIRCGYCRSIHAAHIPGIHAASTENVAACMFMYLLAHYRDTLVERKHGVEAAEELRRMAMKAYLSSPPVCGQGAVSAAEKLGRLISSRGWSPGSTADLTAAALAFFFMEGARI